MLAIISTNCISSTQTIVNTMLQRFINAKVIIHVFTIFFFFYNRGCSGQFTRIMLVSDTPYVICNR
jgi:hypothetical protein